VTALDVRSEWRTTASRMRFGRCHGCGRTHDDDGRPLYLAPGERRQAYLCLACFAKRVKA
jgi:predicted Fe-S protein YdhL (DUF1289 family)